MSDSNARVSFQSVRSKSRHSISGEMISRPIPEFTVDDLLVRVGELATALEKVVAERDVAQSQVKQLQAKLKVKDFQALKSEGVLETDMEMIRNALEEAQRTIRKQSTEKETQAKRITALMSQIQSSEEDLASMKQLNASLIDEIAEERRKARGGDDEMSEDAYDDEATQSISNLHSASVTSSQRGSPRHLPLRLPSPRTNDSTEREIALTATINELTINNNKLKSHLAQFGHAQNLKSTTSDSWHKSVTSDSGLIATRSLPPVSEFRSYAAPTSRDEVNSLSGLNASLVTKPPMMNEPNVSPRSQARNAIPSPPAMSMNSTIQRFTMVDDS